jgi:hypothetical protein
MQRLALLEARLAGGARLEVGSDPPDLGWLKRPGGEEAKAALPTPASE